jgi:small subunit ribosomal protein S6
MEKVINSYESLFIVDVSKGEEVTEAAVNKFTSLIEANAEVIEVAKWGKRRLAYPINDMPEGYYVVVTFKSEPAFPAEFERLANIDEAVLRSMVIKLEYDAVERKAKKDAEAAEKAAAAEAVVAEEAETVEPAEATEE